MSRPKPKSRSTPGATSKPVRQTAAEARAEAEERIAANRVARQAAMDAHFAAIADPGTLPGTALIVANAAVTVLFVALALVGTASSGSMRDLSGNVSLIIAAIGTLLFGLALWDGAQRSRESAMGIGGWFFLAASAPRAAQIRMLGPLLVQVVVGIGTAWATFDSAAPTPTPLAFGTLVPIFGLALCGIWGARYGYFPPRSAGTTR